YGASAHPGSVRFGPAADRRFRLAWFRLSDHPGTVFRGNRARTHARTPARIGLSLRDHDQSLHSRLSGSNAFTGTSARWLVMGYRPAPHSRSLCPGKHAAAAAPEKVHGIAALDRFRRHVAGRTPLRGSAGTKLPGLYFPVRRL